jgi:hypothetical protein
VASKKKNSTDVVISGGKFIAPPPGSKFPVFNDICIEYLGIRNSYSRNEMWVTLIDPNDGTNNIFLARKARYTT